MTLSVYDRITLDIHKEFLKFSENTGDLMIPEVGFQPSEFIRERSILISFGYAGSGNLRMRDTATFAPIRIFVPDKFEKIDVDGLKYQEMLQEIYFKIQTIVSGAMYDITPPMIDDE